MFGVLTAAEKANKQLRGDRGRWCECAMLDIGDRQWRRLTDPLMESSLPQSEFCRVVLRARSRAPMRGHCGTRTLPTKEYCAPRRGSNTSGVNETYLAHM